MKNEDCALEGFFSKRTNNVLKKMGINYISELKNLDLSKLSIKVRNEIQELLRIIELLQKNNCEREY